MRRLLVLGLAALVVIAVASVSFCVLTRPSPVPLAVSDGSIIGTIEGNLTGTSTLNELVSYFNATTYANDSTRAASSLRLSMRTETYYDPGEGDVEILIAVNVSGRIAPVLRPSQINLAVNQTGPLCVVETWGSQSGSNVTFGPGQYITFANNGTGTLTATLVGQGGAQEYLVAYSEGFWIHARPQYNRFVGFRANLGGLGIPVGVRILLKVINDNGGTWA